MAQLNDGSLLEKLLKSTYPLTNYLYRQQQFTKIYSTTQNTAISTTPSGLNSTVESGIIPAQKQKTPLLLSPCFNVPDTLDFNASNHERNDEMDQSSEMEDDIMQTFDETLLKSIGNRINDSNSGLINEKNLSIIKRSSTIQLEFSPYGTNSPLQKAIENGLNIINK